MDKQPSLFKILTNDYIAFTSVMFPLVSWALYLYFLFVEKNKLPDVSLPVVFGAITFLALIFLAWRIVLINKLFDEGTEVSATITRVYFYRDRGRILYTYTYMGETLQAGSLVLKNKRTKAFQPGMSAVIILDQNHPRRTLLRDLFLKGSI